MFFGTGTSVWCLLVLFFMMCRPMKRFTKRLIVNIVERLAMIATPVLVSWFSKKKKQIISSIIPYWLINAKSEEKKDNKKLFF